jgi:hypothetical protein
MGTTLKEYARYFYGASGSFQNFLSGRRAFALGGLPGVQFVANCDRKILALAIAKGTTVSVGAYFRSYRYPHTIPNYSFISVPVVC